MVTISEKIGQLILGILAFIGRTLLLPLALLRALWLKRSEFLESFLDFQSQFSLSRKLIFLTTLWIVFATMLPWVEFRLVLDRVEWAGATASANFSFFLLGLAVLLTLFGQGVGARIIRVILSLAILVVYILTWAWPESFLTQIANPADYTRTWVPYATGVVILGQLITILTDPE